LSFSTAKKKIRNFIQIRELWRKWFFSLWSDFSLKIWQDVGAFVLFFAISVFPFSFEGSAELFWQLKLENLFWNFLFYFSQFWTVFRVSELRFWLWFLLIQKLLYFKTLVRNSDAKFILKEILWSFERRSFRIFNFHIFGLLWKAKFRFFNGKDIFKSREARIKQGTAT